MLHGSKSVTKRFSVCCEPLVAYLSRLWFIEFFFSSDFSISRALVFAWLLLLFSLIRTICFFSIFIFNICFWTPDTIVQYTIISNSVTIYHCSTFFTLAKLFSILMPLEQGFIGELSSLILIQMNGRWFAHMFTCLPNVWEIQWRLHFVCMISFIVSWKNDCDFQW